MVSVIAKIVLGMMPAGPSHHWLRQWLGAVRQHGITLANVDKGLCCHMTSQTTMS